MLRLRELTCVGEVKLMYESVIVSGKRASMGPLSTGTQRVSYEFIAVSAVHT